MLRLAKAGEYRDERTGNHILRMAKYSRLLAEAMGLIDSECDGIELAAPMHDIGKIGITDHILLKRGKLTTAEFEIIKAHPTIGYEILKDSPSQYLQLGAIIAYGHHEKFEGTGYPQGTEGQGHTHGRAYRGCSGCVRRPDFGLPLEGGLALGLGGSIYR